MSTLDVLDLQQTAGNQAVSGLVQPAPPTQQVQRVGGWSDATSKAGTDQAKGEPASGWNAAEHAVGAIRRIPIDGLSVGLQKPLGKSDGGKGLTDEEVAGTVTGPQRLDPADAAGRGRAIALVPAGLVPTKPVDVLFHLHGNTENDKRGFAGWRQHKDSGKVRDVDRDRIAQQIEAAGSSQMVGILPMGVNKSTFGDISPDDYIRDAFDRLAELGAWPAAPKDFRVVLSAHSGGGFTVANILGNKKKQPANLGMIVLFEANNATKYKGKDGADVQIAARNQAFLSWALDQLNGHLRFVKDPAHTDKEKVDRLASAPRLRAFFATGGSYATQYKTMRSTVADWLKANAAAIGPFLPAMTELIQVIEQGGNHETQMQQGLDTALQALPGGGGASGTGVPNAPGSTKLPTGGQVPPTGGAVIPTTAPTTGGSVVTSTGSAAEREALITAARVGSVAGGVTGVPVAMVAFAAGVATGRSPLAAAAAAVVAAGIRTDTDVTDALFALMRPELGGGRIPADRPDLAKEWLGLRSRYARPALAAGRADKTETPTADSPKAPVAPDAVNDSVAENVGAVDGGAKGTKTPTPSNLTPEQEYETFNAKVKGSFRNGLKTYLAVRSLYSQRSMTKGNPAEWLNQLQFGTSFAGTKLNGVHPKLMSALAAVDKEITKQIAAMPAGTPVVFQGDFQPRAVTGKPDKLSDHALGLALHLNYKNNPYIGRNKAATALVARIAEQAKVGGDDFWGSVAGSGRKTSQSRVEEIYHSWASASDAVAKYFLEMKAMRTKKAAGELDTAGLAELAKREDEYKNLRDTDLAKHRDPMNGVFMHTADTEGDPMLQIIKQLTGEAGLEWGGTYGSQAKDLHHFALKV